MFWNTDNVAIARYSHFMLGQIQRNTSLTMAAIAHIAQQADGRVQQGDDKHGYIENAKGAAKRFGRFHVILHGNDLQIDRT